MTRDEHEALVTQMLLPLAPVPMPEAALALVRAIDVFNDVLRGTRRGLNTLDMTFGDACVELRTQDEPE